MRATTTLAIVAVAAVIALSVLFAMSTTFSYTSSNTVTKGNTITTTYWSVASSVPTITNSAVSIRAPITVITPNEMTTLVVIALVTGLGFLIGRHLGLHLTQTRSPQAIT